MTPVFQSTEVIPVGAAGAMPARRDRVVATPARSAPAALPLGLLQKLLI